MTHKSTNNKTIWKYIKITEEIEKSVRILLCLNMGKQVGSLKHWTNLDLKQPVLPMNVGKRLLNYRSYFHKEKVIQECMKISVNEKI